ncbi:MAG: carboxypeptidase-like regulatory domain-containing protein [Candidatus Edwardsbacteria bacterium]|nr:carboxypeptidase-like regulatory domain-containing protein [Candidatus Edwardsbacteria bacterium]
MKKFSLIAIAFMIALQLGCGKDPTGISTGTIKGKISDAATNGAIAGVVISTSPASSSVTTGDDGYYQIDEIKAGAYTVLAAKSGYTSATANVTVDAGKITNANLALVVVTAVPSVPVLVTPHDTVSSVVLCPTFNWNPSSGAASYCIQIAKDSSFTILAAGQAGLYINCFASPSLAESTTYYWRVNASNSIGTSAWSAVWRFATGSSATGNTKPNQPTTPIGPATGFRNQSYEFDFTCSDPDGDPLYFRADWSDGTPMIWTNDYYGWSTYALPHTFKALGTFPIRVQAMDIYGDTSLWSAQTSITIINANPSFSNYYVYPSDGSTCYYSPINFDWDCTDPDIPYDTLSYDMYLDTLNPPVKLQVSNLSSSQYTLSTITNAKTYYWKIVAKDRFGGVTNSSIWSFYKTAK